MATNIVSFVRPPVSSSNANNFKTRNIGTSDCNMFIPFFAVFQHSLITFKDREDVQVLEYSLPIDVPEINGFEYRYDRMIHHLINTMTPKRFKFSVATVPQHVNVVRGAIYGPNENLLICLGINVQYLFSKPIEEIVANPDYSQFCIFVSNELDENPIYKNLKKKLHMDYFPEAAVQGIDIVYTTKIADRLIRNNFVQPKFKNISERAKYLKEEVPKSLLID